MRRGHHPSYAQRFGSDQAAAEYDALYDRPGHDTMVLEAQAVHVQRLADSVEHLWQLDWACGTGRWLKELEVQTEYQRGVDVSEAMLSRAKDRVPSADLVLVGQPEASGEHTGRMLATCFRFLLNADVNDRKVALRDIATASGPDGVLVLNNHGNATSLRTLAWLYRRNDPEFRILSHRRVLKLLRNTGWEVQQVRGIGLFPRRLHRGRWGRRLFHLELRAARSRPLALVSTDVLYTCRRRERIV